SDPRRREAIGWVDDLRRQVRGDTHLWHAFQRALTVAAEYSRQDPGRTVLVRVFTDGLDNDPAYRNKSADEVIAKFRNDFPGIDSETIRANIVLLGDMEMDVRSRAIRVTHDPDVTIPLPPIIEWTPQVVQSGKDVVFSDRSRKEYAYYDWWIDGVPVSRRKTFTHRFASSGKHLVRLQVGSADGLKDFDA